MSEAIDRINDALNTYLLGAIFIGLPLGLVIGVVAAKNTRNAHTKDSDWLEALFAVTIVALVMLAWPFVLMGAPLAFGLRWYLGRGSR